MNLQFNNTNLQINKNGHDDSWDSLMSCEDRQFSFNIDHGGKQYAGAGVRGDDALWIPYSSDVGLKIIANNKRYQSLQESLQAVEYIKNYNSKVFPKIYSCSVQTATNGIDYLLIEMENVSQGNNDFRAPDYVPPKHRAHIENTIQLDPRISNRVIDNITHMKLCPEDEWYKSINLINGKIVDFHRFSVMPTRYKMPSNGKSVHQLFDTYKNMVDRYREVRDHNGTPKWKGKIYQGFGFDNGFMMEGYQSTPSMYDSYHKLPLVPINKSNGGNVLDLGSNQGFFSFQAALHGAQKVIGIELTPQDVDAANDIKEITRLDNVEFINGDIKKFVMETDEKFSLTIFNSVLHQVYPNFQGSEEFMTKLSSITDYLAFETPLNHPLMNISPAAVEQNLRKYFRIVRLIYIYDAYSSGYRANYVCYS